jgi:hypothetical protein
MAGWRFEQGYLERLREDRDRQEFGPREFYYTGARYRFDRDNEYYTVNGYGADVLRQAVELGYQEGFSAGQADQQDQFGFSNTDAFAFQDATYGYAGYVDLPDYQYYFRQGFTRGYQDGYYGRYQYGVYSNGVVNILGGILNQIFNPEPY